VTFRHNPAVRFPLPLSAALAGAFALTLCACVPPTMRPGIRTTPLEDLETVLETGGTEGTAQSKTLDRITVSAKLLSDVEARDRYGANLAKKGMQAIWLRVVNKSPSEQWLLTAHIDPDYYTPDEAARQFRSFLPGRGAEARQQKFRDLAMRSRLESGATHEGHVLIPRSEGGRFIEVTISGSGRERRFGFPLRTPDGHFDFEKLDGATTQVTANLSRPQLRSRLEQLPAATVNGDGSANGDPLNVVIVGEASQVMAALSECGWSFTHRIDWTTVRREIASALRGKPYRTAPVSSLYVFGRSQDLSFQRSRLSISQRSHMRLWQAPYTVEGRPVWVGQVSRDIGIKLTTKSPTLTTHVIDPMVDEARQFVLESLLYRFRIRYFGFVRGSEPAPPESPRHNLTGDPYITDGLRLVVFLASGPVSAGEVRDLGWEKTGKGPIEFGQSGDTGR
jgi:hypothetical protein